MDAWHAAAVENVRAHFDLDTEQGLTDEQAEAARARYGENRLSEGRRRSLAGMALAQLANVLTLILIVAAVVSGVLGELADAVIIIAVVVINTVVGVVQESKAEESLAALKKMASPGALVRRGGELGEIPATAVVPGDLVILEAGRVVPCDLRLTETADLKIDESALTGESLPAQKDSRTLAAEKAQIGDRPNMAFMSTLVTYGRGAGIAVGTGMDTEIGRIATMLESTEDERTPLQKKLDRLGRSLGAIILILCTLMFGVGLLRDFLGAGIEAENVFELFFTAVSLAVAAIPEGMTAIVTIVLAMGVTRMSRRNAIIRSLPAVETLGAVTIICSDKTGTLTQNRMTVRRLYVDGETRNLGAAPGEGEKRLLEAMALCNDASYRPETPGESTGDPTEIALLAAASSAGIDYRDLGDRFPRTGEKPFDSERKMMSTLHRTPEGDYLVCVKGALDSLLPRCDRILIDGEERRLDGDQRERITAAAEEMSSSALRVLAGAYKGSRTPEVEFESALVFAGLQGMIDPPREEVKASIAEALAAGVTPVMITGDHKTTAAAIARELGMAGDGAALSGAEINDLSEAELIDACGRTRVFARVSPEHKVRIVDAFQARGNIVSMTGDGVNDGPSLKSADIGVAMGKSGTDVAKGASDMVLTDDNFGTIVNAIREGRGIYDNIKKTIGFLLSCNAGEIVAVFTAVLLGWATPLRPTHILWVNLITDTFPALALGVDTPDPDIMQRPPRPPKEGLFAGGTGRSILFNGLLIGAITLGIFIWGVNRYPDSLDHARTLAFAVLSLSQLVHAFNLRHPHRSVFALAVNPWLFLALAAGTLLQLAVIMIPAVARFFSVVPLSFLDWTVVGATALLPLVVNEVRKGARKLFAGEEKA